MLARLFMCANILAAEKYIIIHISNNPKYTCVSCVILCSIHPIHHVYISYIYNNNISQYQSLVLVPIITVATVVIIIVTSLIFVIGKMFCIRVSTYTRISTTLTEL